MNVNDATRRGAPEGLSPVTRAPATRRRSPPRRTCARRSAMPRRAGGGSLVPARAPARGHVPDAPRRVRRRTRVLIAAEGDAGGTAAEARRLAGDAARARARGQPDARGRRRLASLRRRCIEGASVGARRVKTRVFRAAEGNGGLDGSLGDRRRRRRVGRTRGKKLVGSPSKKSGAATTARTSCVRSGRLRRWRRTAPPWPRRGLARCSGRGASRTPPPRRTPGLGGAAPAAGRARRATRPSRTRPRAFALETGGEGGARACARAARFATGDLAGAAAAMEASGGDGSKPVSRGAFGGDDDDEIRSKPSVSKRSNASVMNDDASLVAARVARALEAAEKDAFAV